MGNDGAGVAELGYLLARLFDGCFHHIHTLGSTRSLLPFYLEAILDSFLDHVA